MSAVLDAAGVDETTVMGHSLGGFMALAFHYSQPGRVKGLVVVGCGPGYKQDAKRDAWNDRSRSIGQRFDADGLAPLASRGSEVRLCKTHRSAAGIAHAARNMLTQRDDRIINSLPTIKTPTLVVVGEEDRQFLAGSHYMADHIPTAQLVIVPATGHAPNVDDPSIFNATVLNFLQENGL
jgi:pimeloyl-ACP methyl ester carboxylesterase